MSSLEDLVVAELPWTDPDGWDDGRCAWDRLVRDVWFPGDHQWPPPGPDVCVVKVNRGPLCGVNLEPRVRPCDQRSGPMPSCWVWDEPASYGLCPEHFAAWEALW
jgi:hypothetical protein